MSAAVWSCCNNTALGYPVQTLVRFWVNHHFLDLTDRPQWRVVQGRSQTYVDKVLEKLPDVRTSTAVTGVKRTGGAKGGVTVTDSTGNSEKFDTLVMATHTDVSLKILGEGATLGEREVLGAVGYSPNEVYLHRDATLMPKSKAAWASWNCLEEPTDNSDGASEKLVCVTYWVNSLQRLPESTGDLFVTLNPPRPPAKGSMVNHYTLRHPSFDKAAVAAQAALPGIQGEKSTYFCGAWCGYGFHEDGIKSAVDMCALQGVTPPWVMTGTILPTEGCMPKLSLMNSLFVSSFEKAAGSIIKTGSLRLILPNGREMLLGTPKGSAGDTPSALHVRVLVNKWDFFYRIIKDTDIGLGEAYMYGDLEPVGGPTPLMMLMVQNTKHINAQTSDSKLGIINWFGSVMGKAWHAARGNTVDGSRKNIEEHYDLGNDMYELFLDDTWMYSCARFQADGFDRHSATATDMQEAQIRKLDALIEKAEIQEGDRVLDIGCGWGGFAIRCAQKTGAFVTGITISTEQLEKGRQRVKAAGLEHLVELVFCDYRKLDMAGEFDKVVSCEMIEAVGHENLPTYFKMIDRMLKPGGKACLQIISVSDQRYHNYIQETDFIKRHIFPGAVCPAFQEVLRVTRNHTSLNLDSAEEIGQDYATTLRIWHENWVKNEVQIKASNPEVFDDVFFRKWRFYFSYCEAAFEQRYIYLWQAAWRKSETPRPEVFTQAAPDQLMQMLANVWLLLVGVVAGRHQRQLWLAASITLAFWLFSKMLPTLAAGEGQKDSVNVRQSFTSWIYAVLITGLVVESAYSEAPFYAQPFDTSAPCQTCWLALSLCIGFRVFQLFDFNASGNMSGSVATFRKAVELSCFTQCLAKGVLTPVITMVLAGEIPLVLTESVKLLRLKGTVATLGMGLGLLAQTGAQAAMAGWVLQHRAEFAVVSSTWAAGSAGAPQFIASGEVLFCLSVCVMAVLNACDAHALYSLATGSSAPKETVYYSDTVACPWKKAQTGAQSKGKSKKV